MKKCCLFALIAASAFAQSTVFYTWNIQVSPVDTAVPVTTTLDGAVATANYLFKNLQGQTSLSAPCAAAATSCTFASIPAGTVVGNGICFAVPCNIVASATGGPPPTAFSLSSGEVALITGISGNTLTLKRASIGTAVSGTAGQLVSILQAGSYSWQTAQLLAPVLAAIVQNAANGAYTATTQAAIIAAAQASAATAH